MAAVAVLTAMALGHDAAAAGPRAKPSERRLDLALRAGDLPKERAADEGYRADVRPDPWEDLAGLGENPDDAGVPQRREPGNLPAGIGGIGGLLEGETIPIFRWRVKPAL